MKNRFHLYSSIQEKTDYTSDDLPNFNEIEITDLIISDLNLDNLISVKSKYSRFELTNILLYSSYFVQTSFEECLFQNVDFTKSNLSNTSFESCSFISCSFASAEIMGTKITGCNFKQCNFRDIIFSDNIINNTRFEITDRSFSVIDNNIEKEVVWLFV